MDWPVQCSSDELLIGGVQSTNTRKIYSHTSIPPVQCSSDELLVGGVQSFTWKIHSHTSSLPGQCWSDELLIGGFQSLTPEIYRNQARSSNQERRPRLEQNSADDLNVVGQTRTDYGRVPNSPFNGSRYSLPDYEVPNTSRRMISEDTITEATFGRRNGVSCIKCRAREVNVVFLPCGHNMCCHGCALEIHTCPSCSQCIQERATIPERVTS